MKLEKFEKLKVRLEILRLEKNFFTLDRVLYYFSFLGKGICSTCLVEVVEGPDMLSAPLEVC